MNAPHTPNRFAQTRPCPVLPPAAVSTTPDDMRAALAQCQSALARLLGRGDSLQPSGLQIMTLWAECTAAEVKARRVLADAEVVS